MKKTIIALSLIFCAAPTLTNAACYRADLTGTWRLYTVFNSPGRCTLNMPSSGTTISTTSSCYLPGIVNAAPLRGNIAIDAACHVYGTINAGGLIRSIDGWISRGKDSISGIGWSPSNVYIGKDFSGVKQ